MTGTLPKDANNNVIQRPRKVLMRAAVLRAILVAKAIVDHVATVTTSVAHGFAAGQEVVLETVAAARLPINTQPDPGDTVRIGGDVYEFVDGEGEPPEVSADGNIAVVIAGSAALTRTALVAAINGTAEDAGVKKTNGVATAFFIGTEEVLAVVSGNGINLFNADAAGGDKLAGSQDLELDTDVAALSWDIGNEESMSVSEYFDGTFTIATVPSDTTFTFATPAAAVPASLADGNVQSAAASPLASDTSDIRLIWPENAIGLRVLPVDEDARLQGDGSITLPQGVWFDLPGCGGHEMLITRQEATGLEFLFETLD